MKRNSKINQWVILAVLFIWACPGVAQEPVFDDEIYYYGIEIGGVVCGYSESSQRTVIENGKEYLQANDEVVLKLTVLGQGVDISITNDYKIDPETGRYFFCERNFSNGAATLISTTKVKGEIAYFSSNMDVETKEIDLSGGVILDSPIEFKHLMREIIEGDEKEKNYKVFDDMKGVIVDKVYTFLRSEEIELVGNTYSAAVIAELDKSTGTRITYWIESSTGFPLKLMFSGKTIYLADASVKKRIKTADYDDLIFARVDKVIPNVQGLTYMKVDAKIKSEGEWITAESLNFPGQSFTGIVTDNMIEGVFEIEPIRCDGTNAPGFPFDYPLHDSLQKYIEPENLIESDHLDLITEAKEITKDVENSWDAVVSLSKWVAENIKGAIPGGTSAINTYNTRLGECGSHSRLLAAFCRSVGIPARLSIGCMYSTYYRGSFGQHAWTEVFMGDAGWVAVDATTHEIDFVDAGHIRLGELTTFQPLEMEILDYRLIDGSEENVDNVVPERYQAYIGKYIYPERNAVFEILYKDGSLAVDIPNKMILALNDADENGLFYPQISRQINFKFIKNDQGEVNGMRLQEIIPIPKTSDEDPINSDYVQNNYAGTYYFAQAEIKMLVYIKDKSLVLRDPIAKTESNIQQNLETGIWTIGNKNELMFEKDADGNVTGINYLKNTILKKEGN
jgi:hypothetical protein